MKQSKTKHSKTQAFNKLYKAMAVIENSAEAQRFLTDLCTPAELQAMVDRWLVVKPIKEGVPYRQIYQDTGVSATTVTRVARTLSLGSGGYDLIYQRVEQQDNDE